MKMEEFPDADGQIADSNDKHQCSSNKRMDEKIQKVGEARETPKAWDKSWDDDRGAKDNFKKIVNSFSKKKGGAD